MQAKTTPQDPFEETIPTAPQQTREEPKSEPQTVAQKRHARRSWFEQMAGQVLSGSILTRAEVRRQYPYIFFMMLLMFLYIANGYHIQKLHRRQEKITEQIKELRSKSMTLSSMRMSATRQSAIIEELERREIPLRESLTPAKVIKK